MEDFYDAGGLPGLLSRIRERLNLNCLTVNGKTLGENIAGAAVYNDDVILPLDRPLSHAGATFVLRGNLARAARSSNPPPPTRDCSSTRARPWSFATIRR